MGDSIQSTPALPSRLTSVRAGINAGGIAGLVGASVEGLLNVLGIDPSVFIYHLQKFGPGALTHNLPAWQELPSLLGAWIVSYLFYCGGRNVPWGFTRRPAALAARGAHPDRSL